MTKIAVRGALVSAMALLILGTLAPPASAHTISGPRPSNYRTRLVSITPAVPGISMRVVDLGSQLELTNTSGRDVIVLAAEGEPYLKIGPSGSYENLLSPATYRNRTRSGQTAVPPEAANAKPSDPPKWHKISSGQTVRWHEHRAHWMGGLPPPPVRASPGSFFHIGDWQITMFQGTTRIVANGTLDWVPGPSGLGWWPLAIALFAIGVLAGLWRRGLRVVGALVGVLVVVDAAHAISYEMSRPGSTLGRIGQFFGQNFVSIIVWVAAIAVIVGLIRRRPEALYGAIFVALMVALVGGATDLSALWKSQLPLVGPGWIARAEVVTALALGLGVAVGALARAVRTERRTRAAEAVGWLSLLVEGLDDDAVAKMAAELEPDDVLGAAFADAARRVQPVSDEFERGSIVFVVDGDPWSLALANGGVSARSGRVEPVGAEIDISFARLLQVLGGSRTLDAAPVRGDAASLARVAPYLAETSDVRSTPRDRASAS